MDRDNKSGKDKSLRHGKPSEQSIKPGGEQGDGNQRKADHAADKNDSTDQLSAQEEADLEQQRKETLTERD